MSAAIITPTQELESRALTLAEQASAIAISDQPTYEKACTFLTSVILPMEKEIEDTFTPIVAKAHAAHKEACDQRTRHLAPVMAAKTTVKIAIGQYDFRCEQERIRRQREAEEVARQQEEADLEQQIEQAEANGATPEHIEQILNTPSSRPLPVVPSSVAPVKGVSTRMLWKAEVTNKKALLEYVLAHWAQYSNLIEINEPVLNKLAAAYKTSMNIPGVRAVQTPSVAGRAGR